MKRLLFLLLVLLVPFPQARAQTAAFKRSSTNLPFATTIGSSHVFMIDRGGGAAPANVTWNTVTNTIEAQMLAHRPQVDLSADTGLPLLASRAATGLPLRILWLGDSIGDDTYYRTLAVVKRLHRDGVAWAAFNTVDPENYRLNSANDGYDSALDVWYVTANFYRLNSGNSSIWGGTGRGGFTTADTAQFWFLRSATGGVATVSISTDDSSWTDIISVNTAGARAVLCTNVNFTRGSYSIKIAASGGAVNYIWPALLDSQSTAPRLSVANAPGRSVNEFYTAGVASAATLLTNLVPDLIVWQQTKDLTNYSRFTNVNSWFSTYAPQANVLLISPHAGDPTNAIVGVNHEEQQTRMGREIARTNGWAYLDVYHPMPWASVVSNSFSSDGIHFNDAGKRWEAERFMSAVDLRALVAVNNGAVFIAAGNSGSLTLQVPGGYTEPKMTITNGFGIQRTALALGRTPYVDYPNFGGGLGASFVGVSNANFSIMNTGRVAVALFPSGGMGLFPTDETTWPDPGNKTFSSFKFEARSTGGFYGDGSGLTNVPWASLSGVPAGFADGTDDGGVGGGTEYVAASTSIDVATNSGTYTPTVAASQTNTWNLAATNAAAAATNGLAVALTNIYQPKDSDLTTYAGITPSANVQSLLGAANYSAMRTLLTLVPGTDVQAYDADLASLAGASSTALYYRSAANTWSPVTVGIGLSFSSGVLSNTATAGTPGGSANNVQYQSGSAFAGENAFSYDASSDTLTVSNLVAAGTATVGTITTPALNFSTNAFASGYPLDCSKSFIGLATNNTVQLGALSNWIATNVNQVCVYITNTSATPFAVLPPSGAQYMSGGTAPYCTNVWQGVFWSAVGMGTNYFSRSR